MKPFILLYKGRSESPKWQKRLRTKDLFNFKMMDTEQQYNWSTNPLNPRHDLIYDRVYELVIEVIPIDDDQETQQAVDQTEVRYYGDDYGDPLMFQTVGYKSQPDYAIELAIRWYASGPLDYPQMELNKTPI